METLVVLIVVASAIWVYVDATNHKIGKIPNKGGMFNMSAGAWSVVTLLLWIVGFPAYLVKRSALIQEAATSPVEVGGRAGKIAALAIVGGFWLVGTLAGSVASVDGPRMAVDDVADAVQVSDLEVVTSSLGVRAISGIATNTTDQTIGLVNLEFNLYDENDVQVGSTIANVQNLEPNGKWRFEAMILQDDATQYKLVGITAL
jgi:hypothetical protein